MVPTYKESSLAGLLLSPDTDPDTSLVAFHVLVKSLISRGILEPRLMLAAIQLQLESDHEITMKDKLDLLVQTGQAQYCQITKTYSMRKYAS